MRIKDIRTQKGVSQKELADIIGVAPNTLSQYENGKRAPDFDTLAKISDYFHVSVDYLLGLNDPEKKPAPTDGDGHALDARLVERLIQLSPEEQEKVEAFVQGLIAGREGK